MLSQISEKSLSSEERQEFYINELRANGLPDYQYIKYMQARAIKGLPKQAAIEILEALKTKDALPRSVMQSFTSHDVLQKLKISAKFGD